MTEQCGGDRISVSRRSSRPPVADGPGGDPVHRVTDGIPSLGPAAEVTVSSPSVGIFRRAAALGAPAPVDVGSSVEAGDPVGFVEVMDRVVPVPAGVAGTVSAVVADDGAMVEYGERLALVARREEERGLGHG
jgi:acetyl-CoA carboxylase biotin carboxyl carrier protein